jgi:hypothetical protein
VEGLFLAANPGWLGLPGTGEVSNHAVLIGLYVPVSVAIGLLAALPVERLGRWGPLGHGLLAVAVVVVGLWGARQSAGIVNPYFQLVTQADEQAMSWIRANTAPEARFLVNSEPAYGGNVVVGTDAGWWLPLLGGRQNTLPPMTYNTEQAPAPDFRQRINALAEVVRTHPPGSAETLDALQAAGVTHVYVGTRGGALKPEELAALPVYQTLYRRDGAWVFQIDYGKRVP